MESVKYVPIITRKESCKLNVQDICYIYRSNRKLLFATDCSVICTYGKMDEIEKLLEPDFYRCMSGFIVNLAKITDMKCNSVSFENGKTFKLGRETYLRLKQRFNAYLLSLLGQYENSEDK